MEAMAREGGFRPEPVSPAVPTEPGIPGSEPAAPEARQAKQGKIPATASKPDVAVGEKGIVKGGEKPGGSVAESGASGEPVKSAHQEGAALETRKGGPGAGAGKGLSSAGFSPSSREARPWSCSRIRLPSKAPRRKGKADPQDSRRGKGRERSKARAAGTARRRRRRHRATSRAADAALRG